MYFDMRSSKIAPAGPSLVQDERVQEPQAPNPNPSCTVVRFGIQKIGGSVRVQGATFRNLTHSTMES